jgi:hypothetical protein
MLRVPLTSPTTLISVAHTYGLYRTLTLTSWIFTLVMSMRTLKAVAPEPEPELEFEQEDATIAAAGSDPEPEPISVAVIPEPEPAPQSTGRSVAAKPMKRAPSKATKPTAAPWDDDGEEPKPGSSSTKEVMPSQALSRLRMKIEEKQVKPANQQKRIEELENLLKRERENFQQMETTLRGQLRTEREKSAKLQTAVGGLSSQLQVRSEENLQMRKELDDLRTSSRKQLEALQQTSRERTERYKLDLQQKEDLMDRQNASLSELHRQLSELSVLKAPRPEFQADSDLAQLEALVREQHDALASLQSRIESFEMAAPDAERGMEFVRAESLLCLSRAAEALTLATNSV